MKMTNSKSFILGFALCLILVGAGVGATVFYYLNIKVGGTKMPSTYTPQELSVFVAEIAGMSGKFNKDSTAELVVSLPPLQENNTIVTKEYHIQNMESNPVVVTFDSLTGVPDGAVVTIVCKMTDPWNAEGRLPYTVGSTKTIINGDTFYFWIQLEDQGMDEGNYNFTLKFHIG